MKAQVELKVLHLIDPFGIARGTTTTQTVAVVDLDGGGHGEAAPVKYHNQTAEGEAAAIQAMVRDVPDEPWDLEGILEWLRHRYPDHSAALCAVDLALHDWVARRLNVPLHRLFMCDAPSTKQTSFTIGIDTEEVMLKKVEKASEHPVLKIKLGRNLDHDLSVMKAIRKAVPEKVLRVDANAGWTLDEARRAIPALADLGVEYVEQPLPIGAFEDLATLKRESSLPLFCDEDVFTTRDVVRLVGKCDGVNIKLMKCGGLLEARKMINVARAHGLQLMIGCMIETSLAITAAAHLSALIDHLDLDGHLLIRDDPYVGMTLEGPEKYIHLPEGRPGIGVIPRV